MAHVSYPQYIAQTHWLVWLLVKHWMSIATGALVASAVSISTRVWLAQAIGLSDMLQKGLAVTLGAVDLLLIRPAGRG